MQLEQKRMALEEKKRKKTTKKKKEKADSDSEKSESEDSSSSSSSDSERRKKKKKSKKHKKEKKHKKKKKRRRSSSLSSDSYEKKKKKKKRSESPMSPDEKKVESKKVEDEEDFIIGPAIPDHLVKKDEPMVLPDWDITKDPRFVILFSIVDSKREIYIHSCSVKADLFFIFIFLNYFFSIKKDMLRGEAAAMAAYVAQGKRIPRRGEIGLSSEEISTFEKVGYVMSGTRHKAMEATRLRKENQVMTADEKRLLSGFTLEQRQKKEETIMQRFRTLIDSKKSKD